MLAVGAAREAEDREKRSPEQNMMDGSRDVYLEQLEGLSGRRSALASAKRPQFCVAVVLGKALCSGRISVEHAARCSALARALLERRLDPDQVVFTASAASKAEGCGDDATVACSYFLHLCEALGVVSPQRPKRTGRSAGFSRRSRVSSRTTAWSSCCQGSRSQAIQVSSLSWQ